VIKEPTKETTPLRDESILVRPGEGKILKLIGQTMEIKVSAEQTGGRWAFIEGSIEPGRTGPPLHFHSNEDEVYYVIEGALLFQLGDRQVKATAGCLAYVPKGSAHAFCNPYKEPARLVGFIAPAGFEKYFEETANYLHGLPAGEPPDLRVLQEFSERHHSVMVGPPMSPAMGSDDE
jgi:mannose-6-phosphate isomerase-like protein (cupin superfamily)